MPLLVHGEVTDPEVDVFDREAVFIDRVLAALLRDFPGAEDRVRAYHHRRGGRISSTAAGRTSRRRSRRSICIINRNALFAGGLRPHAYCLPVAKREEHRLAVRRAATSGSPKFFLGTDSAPHAVERKESAAAAPASSTRPSRSKAMRRCSRRKARSTGSRPSPRRHGPRFYGLPLNEGRVTLERAEVDGAGRRCRRPGRRSCRSMRARPCAGVSRRRDRSSPSC